MDILLRLFISMAETNLPDGHKATLDYWRDYVERAPKEIIYEEIRILYFNNIKLQNELMAHKEMSKSWKKIAKGFETQLNKLKSEKNKCT